MIETPEQWFALPDGATGDAKMKDPEINKPTRWWKNGMYINLGIDFDITEALEWLEQITPDEEPQP